MFQTLSISMKLIEKPPQARYSFLSFPSVDVMEFQCQGEDQDPPGPGLQNKQNVTLKLAKWM